MPEPLRLKGIAASGGYAEGPLFPLHREDAAAIWREATPHDGSARRCERRSRMRSARIGDADRDAPAGERRDPRIPARDAGGQGADRAGLRGDRRRHRGRRRLGRRASMPRSSATRFPATTISGRAPPTSRTSASRCCAALTDGGDEASPPGAILFGDDIAPTRFLETDWSPGGGIALTAGSTASHVAMLARSRGVPMVVGLGAARRSRSTASRCSTPSMAASCSARRRRHRARSAAPRTTTARAAPAPTTSCCAPRRPQAGTAGARAGQHRRSRRRRRDRHRRLRRRRADAHRIPVRQGIRPARRGDAIRAPTARCSNGPAASR